MSDSAALLVPNPRYAWLALALPAEARSFRTDDSELAAMLGEAGAKPTASKPDVEIAAANRLRGDAETAVVPIYRSRPRGRSRAGRAAGRVPGGVGLSLGIWRAQRAARRLGYTASFTITWERSMPVVAPGFPKAEGSPLAHRFPMNGIVVAGRDLEQPTIFERVLRAATNANHQVSRPSEIVFGSSGVVVANLGEAVLRVAVGRPSARIVAQRDVIAELLAEDPTAELSAKIPKLIADSREGLATWTLEHRLSGTHPAQLGDTVADDSLVFLVELGRIRAPGSARERIQAAVEAVGRECSDDVAGRVARAATDALDELADLPSCFTHGDFWHGNLLVENDRLSGVIDWSAGGPDGFPMLDVLHLHLSSIRQETGEPLGLAVAEHLLSESLAGSTLLRAYNRLLGLKLTDAEQSAVIVGYWLDALARDLRDPDAPRDGGQGSWERQNVVPVLRALESERRRQERSAAHRATAGSS